VAAPPLTEWAQRKIAFSVFVVGVADVEREQHLFHVLQVLAGFLEEDLVELAEIDAGGRWLPV
jgi:hypothetical protein